MKHLDVVDGIIAAIPVEERPASSSIGENLTLLILKLRTPDAETWIACTATFAVIRLEEQHIQDYLLLSNGLMQSTPCDLVLAEEVISHLDDLMLGQLYVEDVGFTDASTIYIATAYVQQSYTELIRYLSMF